jgi:hypothetical protein
MSVHSDTVALADELREVNPSFRTDIQTFPSGAINLDVHFGNRMFVLAYFPSYKSFCVDEVTDDNSFGAHYQFGFDDFQSAKDKLLAMLREATMKNVEEKSKARAQSG